MPIAAIVLFLLCIAPRATAQDVLKLDAGLDREGAHSVFVRGSKQLLGAPHAFAKFCRDEAKRKRSELRTSTIASLRSIADAAWDEMSTLVAELEDAGGISSVQRTWIVSGFFCKADAESCRRLAALESVDFIYRQRVMRQEVVRTTPVPEAARERMREVLERKTRTVTAEELDALEVIPWNLRRVRAPEAWPIATGRGVVIAMIDTGLCETPSLLDALWRNEDEALDGKDTDGNGYVDDLYGWDFGRGNSAVLGDARGHGSMCAGIAAGRPALGRAFGVAPNSRLMVLRGGGGLRAYEYAVANGADVVSMSYMWINRPLGHYRAVYRLAHEHMCAAGVVAVGGAGNFAKKAPVGKQIALPKDIPCVIAAAGVLENGELAPPSSRGPVSWKGVRGYDEADDATTKKPDVTTCFGGYPVWAPKRMRLRPRWKRLDTDGDGQLITGPQGNSFSGPHVAGTVALMLEVNPELTAWRVKELLESTCKDLGPKGHDSGFGHGLVQADKAVEAARR